jgi:hypothetical protein
MIAAKLLKVNQLSTLVVGQFEDRRQFPGCGLQGSQGVHFDE